MKMHCDANLSVYNSLGMGGIGENTFRIEIPNGENISDFSTGFAWQWNFRVCHKFPQWDCQTMYRGCHNKRLQDPLDRKKREIYTVSVDNRWNTTVLTENRKTISNSISICILRFFWYPPQSQLIDIRLMKLLFIRFKGCWASDFVKTSAIWSADEMNRTSSIFIATIRQSENPLQFAYYVHKTLTWQLDMLPRCCHTTAQGSWLINASSLSNDRSQMSSAAAFAIELYILLYTHRIELATHRKISCFVILLI